MPQRSLITVAVIAASLGGTLSAQEMPRGGEKRRFSSDYPVHPAVPFGPSLGISPGAQAHPYWYGGYYGTPWYVQQTRKYKFPAPVYAEPRLGLQYLYPNAYQFGLQMPPETDEPVVDLSRGIFPGSQAVSTAIEEGEALMRKGHYAEAGRMFAKELRDEDTPPEVYLHLAEALLALGKARDADVVLRQAIETAPDLDFLSRREVVEDFPSADALKKLAEGVDANLPLLRGTFLVLAGEGEKGLEALRGAQEKEAAAKKVYLRFLGAAFDPPPGEKTPPAPEKKEPAPAPQEKTP